MCILLYIHISSFLCHQSAQLHLWSECQSLSVRISLRPSTARGARSAPDGPATTRPSTARASAVADTGQRAVRAKGRYF